MCNKENKKRLKAKDLIGWESEDGNLKVVGTCGKTRWNETLFKVVCKICSEDKELFPDGYFISTKGNLVSGQKPCGCSKSPKWTASQYLVKAARVCEKKNLKVNGFAEEFYGFETRINCECEIDGHRWTPSLHSIINQYSGCPKCKYETLAQLLKTSEVEAYNRCKVVCDNLDYNIIGFPKGYKNIFSRFEYVCSVHGVQNVCYNHFINNKSKCPSCSKTGYSPDKQGTLYIVKWKTDDKCFIKFGITNRDVITRVGEQANNTDYKYEILAQYTWEDGRVADRIEKLIKKCGLFDINVVDKKDFNSGFSETIHEEDLYKLLEFIKVHSSAM